MIIGNFSNRCRLKSFGNWNHTTTTYKICVARSCANKTTNTCCSVNVLLFVINQFQIRFIHSMYVFVCFAGELNEIYKAFWLVKHELECNRNVFGLCLCILLLWTNVLHRFIDIVSEYHNTAVHLTRNKYDTMEWKSVGFLMFFLSIQLILYIFKIHSESANEIDLNLWSSWIVITSARIDLSHRVLSVGWRAAENRLKTSNLFVLNYYSHQLSSLWANLIRITIAN